MSFKIDLHAAMTSPGLRVELVKHKKYSRWPRAGELYGIEIADVGWLVSRVISDCPSELPGERGDKTSGIILLYVYEHVYPNCAVSVDFIRSSQLILPPIMVTYKLWRNGYMTPLGCVDFDSDLLEKHCFWHQFHEKFHDEYGKVLKNVVRPCGLSNVFLYDGFCKLLGKSLRDGFDQDRHSLS